MITDLLTIKKWIINGYKTTIVSVLLMRVLDPQCAQFTRKVSDFIRPYPIDSVHSDYGNHGSDDNNLSLRGHIG